MILKNNSYDEWFWVLLLTTRKTGNGLIGDVELN